MICQQRINHENKRFNFELIVICVNFANSIINDNFKLMRVDLNTFEEIDRPIYIIEEDKLRDNLSLISDVARKANVEVILALKAFALWKTFPIFKEYIHSTTASSLYEARMAFEEFGSKVHTFSPAYTDYEIADIARYSSHISFNSLTQFDRYKYLVKKNNPEISIGLRINPEYSEVGTALYNPCAPGTRFGINSKILPEILPDEVEGFHCHCHCESGSDVFERTLVHIEEKFSKWFLQLKWINFGGGHLMTRNDYDIHLLIQTIQKFHTRYPNLKIIFEPGSAFAWQTGTLISQIVDIVEDHGIKTAILNVSFTCHMPDCLEMPYMPTIRGAKIIVDENITDYDKSVKYNNVYRMGGNSCLSGDFLGCWQFDHELKVGENIIFEDMLHYTMVKTCMFNGVSHPSIGIALSNGELEILRDFSYEDYKSRMD
jgi:carboxynorspermidine decarboxylase